MIQENAKVELVTENGNAFPEIKTILAENGNLSESRDLEVVSEGFGAVSVYDQWVAPPISGVLPKARYEVALFTGLCYLSNSSMP